MAPRAPRTKLTFKASPVRVRVPATSANLGSAFDCGGLALSMYDELVAQITDEVGITVDMSGEGAETFRVITSISSPKRCSLHSTPWVVVLAGLRS